MNLESVWRAFLGATQWPSNDPWRARGAVQSLEIVSTFSTGCLSVSGKKNIFSLIDRSAGCGFCGCAGCESCNKLDTRLTFGFRFDFYSRARGFATRQLSVDRNLKLCFVFMQKLGHLSQKSCDPSLSLKK